MADAAPISVCLTHAAYRRDDACSVVVIDQLRAGTTIPMALSNGAGRVIPVTSVDEALARRDSLRRENPSSRVLLGGERGGVLIPGFDLGNSPREYTRERVEHADIIFTTTNGTAALHAARHSPLVVVACLANLSAAAAVVDREPRSISILCAGTHGMVGLDDALVAGALVRRLSDRPLSEDDAARLCLACWDHAAEDIRTALASSLGGRGLLALNQHEDLDFCAQIDLTGVVPRLTTDGSLVPASLGE
jgi:2-phosphosulfolactate phosphatase